MRLIEADIVLQEAGWKPNQDASELANVAAGKNRGLYYAKDGLQILLAYYISPTFKNAPIKKLIDDQKITPLNNGEVIYGISAYTSYWSCRQESFFVQPCPTPPSEPYYTSKK